MTYTIPKHKWDKKRKGKRGGVHRATVPDDFNGLKPVIDYLYSYPPKPNTPLISGHGEQVLWDDDRAGFRQLAQEHGIAERILVPHSHRSGALAAMDNNTKDIVFTPKVRTDQGDWSAKGEVPYDRKTMRHVEMVAPALGDRNAIPLAITLDMYATTSPQSPQMMR